MDVNGGITMALGLLSGGHTATVTEAKQRKTSGMLDGC
ncbi:MAG: hypothetical protein ACI8PG_004383 [Planctomycetota bacterium]|jgi:hypothetical protein